MGCHFVCPSHCQCRDQVLAHLAGSSLPCVFVAAHCHQDASIEAALVATDHAITLTFRRVLSLPFALDSACHPHRCGSAWISCVRLRPLLNLQILWSRRRSVRRRVTVDRHHGPHHRRPQLGRRTLPQMSQVSRAAPARRLRLAPRWARCPSRVFVCD